MVGVVVAIAIAVIAAGELLTSWWLACRAVRHALRMRPFLDRAFDDYSYGLKRTQIVAATCHAPELVVLDVA